MVDVIEDNSIYRHFGQKLANYKGFPLVVGGLNPDVPSIDVWNTVEMFDINENKWVSKADYPFAKRYI